MRALLPFVVSLVESRTFESKSTDLRYDTRNLLSTLRALDVVLRVKLLSKLYLNVAFFTVVFVDRHYAPTKLRIRYIIVMFVKRIAPCVAPIVDSTTPHVIPDFRL